LLSAVGDSLGYRNGLSGFCRSGPALHADIHKESPSGVNGITVAPPSWKLSDATVMSLGTAEAITGDLRGEELTAAIAQNYVQAMKDTAERSLGKTTSQSLRQLARDCSDWSERQYSPTHGGCNPAVRAATIGLLLPGDQDYAELVQIAVDSCWITHHHPTAFLGAVTAAAFTGFAVRGLPLREWGYELLTNIMPLVAQYFESNPLLAHNDMPNNTLSHSLIGQQLGVGGMPAAEQQLEESQRPLNVREMHHFITKWTDFLQSRGLPTPGDSPNVYKDGEGVRIERGTYLHKPPPAQYPAEFGPRERDEFYKSLSYSGWAGASGHDATIIAFDSVLGSNSWEEVCSRAMLHGGDSASTGSLAGAWYGAMHGLWGVPSCHYENVEYHDRLESCATQLLKAAARQARVQNLGQP